MHTNSNERRHDPVAIHARRACRRTKAHRKRDEGVSKGRGRVSSFYFRGGIDATSARGAGGMLSANEAAECNVIQSNASRYDRSTTRDSEEKIHGHCFDETELALFPAFGKQELSSSAASLPCLVERIGIRCSTRAIRLASLGTWTRLYASLVRSGTENESRTDLVDIVPRSLRSQFETQDARRRSGKRRVRTTSELVRDPFCCEWLGFWFLVNPFGECIRRTLSSFPVRRVRLRFRSCFLLLRFLPGLYAEQTRATRLWIPLQHVTAGRVARTVVHTTFRFSLRVATFPKPTKTKALHSYASDETPSSIESPIDCFLR